MSNILLAITCLALGKLLQQVKQFPDTSAHVLNSYVIYVALPALILVQISKIALDADLLAPVIIAWLVMGMSAGITWLLARRGKWSAPVTGAMLLVITLGNTSFIGFPLIEAHLGAAALPFQIDEHVEVGEDARLRHRYLDLRRPEPARIMRLRSDANRVAREMLHEDGFTEVETPTLTRSTPEGARDFLVPARLQPGSWYALPQSPQLFKQLLMVGGMERYYQIARCYRDEDFRADRQPEFTQLDIEMSFVTEDDVISLGESIVTALWKELAGHEISQPIPRITWHDAMARYGSDKPDLRFGLELTELTDYLRGTSFRVFAGAIDAGGYVGAVVMPGGASQPRRTLDSGTGPGEIESP